MRVRPGAVRRGDLHSTIAKAVNRQKNPEKSQQSSSSAFNGWGGVGRVV